MPTPKLGLLTEDEAAYYTGRPASTIRRWAAEGRINRYGSGRGKVRYLFTELNMGQRDEWTRALLLPGEAPALPHRRARAA
jgi:excisionase family DNA binding protein